MFLNLDKNDWKDIASHIVPAAAAAFAIAWVGSSVKASWLVIPVTPALTVAGSYLISKYSDPKTKRDSLKRAGLFGLIFGVVAYLFS